MTHVECCGSASRTFLEGDHWNMRSLKLLQECLADFQSGLFS